MAYVTIIYRITDSLLSEMTFEGPCESILISLDISRKETTFMGYRTVRENRNTMTWFRDFAHILLTYSSSSGFTSDINMCVCSIYSLYVRKTYKIFVFLKHYNLDLDDTHLSGFVSSSLPFLLCVIFPVRLLVLCQDIKLKDLEIY